MDVVHFGVQACRSGFDDGACMWVRTVTLTITLTLSPSLSLSLSLSRAVSGVVTIAEPIPPLLA